MLSLRKFMVGIVSCDFRKVVMVDQEHEVIVVTHTTASCCASRYLGFGHSVARQSRFGGGCFGFRVFRPCLL